MDYYSKYLKYKNKYISLQNHRGGVSISPQKEYIVLGHACDIMNGNTLEEVEITGQNKYITSVVCGDPNAHDNNYNIYTQLQTNKDKTLFEIVLSEKELNTNLHIVGCTGTSCTKYVNNRFTPYVDAEPLIFLYRSGLLPVDIIKEKENKYSNIIYVNDEYGFIDPIGFSVDINDVTNTSELVISDGSVYDDVQSDVKSKIKKLLELAYYGSVYPTIAQVLDIFDEVFDDRNIQSTIHKSVALEKFQLLKKTISDKYKLTISELFKKFPGIYLQQGCRVICGKENLTLEEKSSRDLRRQVSNSYS